MLDARMGPHSLEMACNDDGDLIPDKMCGQTLNININTVNLFSLSTLTTC